MQTERMDTVLAAERLGKQVSSPEGVLAILSDVSLAIARGETVAIMGANGAGKSTLLALLAGLDEPTSGTVRLADNELTARRPVVARRLVDAAGTINSSAPGLDVLRRRVHKVTMQLSPANI